MSPRTGQQIAVAMTVRDERRFLAFLRTTADVQILALNRPSADHVWLNAFPPRRSQDRLSRGFVLWNRAFGWEPEIQTFQHGAGVVNAHRAPVIEYLRHPFFVLSREAGRLFWSRGVTIDGPYLGEDKVSRYAYDPERFDVWWRQVIQWIKANSYHRSDQHGFIHYLPWAWWMYGRWGRG